MITKSFPKSKNLENGRFNDIAFIKTNMMICVVLCHATAFFTGNWFSVYTPVYSAGYLASFSDFLGFFHIQSFTMASGFLFYYLILKKGRYDNPKKDIKKRAQRLLVPYLFTSVLWAIPIGAMFFNYSWGDIINKYVLMTGPAQLWFLIMLFIVFVFFVLIGKKIKLSFRNLVLVYIVTTTIGSLLSMAHLNYFQIPISVRYILFFYLGGYIYKNRKAISWKQTIMMTLMAVGLYALVARLGNSDKNIIKCGISFIEPLISLLAVSVSYFLCNRLVLKNGGIVRNRFYRLLEDNSFGIYLFHQQNIYFTIALLNGLVHPIAQALLSFVIAMVVSVSMSFILKKWRMTRWMFGL